MGPRAEQHHAVVPRERLDGLVLHAGAILRVVRDERFPKVHGDHAEQRVRPCWSFAPVHQRDSWVERRHQSRGIIRRGRVDGRGVLRHQHWVVGLAQEQEGRAMGTGDSGPGSQDFGSRHGRLPRHLVQLEIPAPRRRRSVDDGAPHVVGVLRVRHRVRPRHQQPAG